MAKTTTKADDKTKDGATDAKPKAKAPSVTAQNKAVKALLDVKGDVIGLVSGNVENLTSKKALEVLPELFNRVDTTFFVIGGILARVQEEQWWQDAGYESLKDYVEEEFGLASRTASYWIAIYRDLVASEVNFEEVADIGWSKLKEISPMLNTENVEEWATRAREMSLRQLIEYIKAMKAGSSGGGSDDPEVDPNKSDVKPYTFKLHEDERSSVGAAVESAMEQLGTEYPSVAITHICDQYLAGDGTGKAKGGDLKDMMNGAGYEKVLEIIEEIFPQLDMEVSVIE